MCKLCDIQKAMIERLGSALMCAMATIEQLTIELPDPPVVLEGLRKWAAALKGVQATLDELQAKKEATCSPSPT